MEMKHFVVPAICLAIHFFGGSASGALLDLNAFAMDEGIAVEEGLVTFQEDPGYLALYFYNDDFLVDSEAEVLSFDYDFQLGMNDYYDYLTFEVDFTPMLDVFTNGSGHFEFDLSSYRGSTISLAWGLLWDGDEASGTTATIWNLDLATTSEVPEPASLFLLASGLVGLGVGSKKTKNRIQVLSVNSTSFSYKRSADDVYLLG